MMAVGCLYALARSRRARAARTSRWPASTTSRSRVTSTPPLTTVRVRIADLGRSALEQLVARWKAPSIRRRSSTRWHAKSWSRASCGRRAAATLPNDQDITGRRSGASFPGESHEHHDQPHLRSKKKLLASLIRQAGIAGRHCRRCRWAQSADATLRGKAPRQCARSPRSNVATGAARARPRRATAATRWWACRPVPMPSMPGRHRTRR